MASDSSDRIDALCLEALSKDAADRAAFLDEACAGDDALRREVESLLAARPSASALLGTPAWSAAGPVAPGTRLGPYEILSLVGEGGMGQVYKARDTRLDRIVAIKVLPPAFASDPARRARFEREATTIAALSHPNICPLHDVGREGDVDFLVMEYLEGQTLAARLEKGKLPLDRALAIAAQIADALSAAHRQGVVHRDLKPANVVLVRAPAGGPSGPQAKLLDFGLARLTGHGEQAAVSQLASGGKPTLTAEGAIVGTLQYMAPEQLEGKPADARTDIWALGAILHEMLTGKRAFEGTSAASLVAAIMSARPPGVVGLDPLMPPAVERLLERCLEKEPDRRWQTASDLAAELRWIAGSDARGPALAGVRHRRSTKKLWWLAGAAALALVAAVAGFSLLRKPSAPPPRLVQLTSFPGSEVQPALSPDGRQVAFVWNGEKGDNFDIYVQMIGEERALRLTTDPAPDSVPAWSPDGRWLAFSRTQARAGLYVISALGGRERKVADLRGLPHGSAPVRFTSPSLAWTPDAKWLVTVDSEAPPQGEALLLVSLTSGVRRRLAWDPQKWHSSPALSPDGHEVAYAACAGEYECVVQVLRLSADFLPDGPPRTIGQPTTRVQGMTWSADGRSLIYAASPGGANTPYLWRIPAAGRSVPERVELAGRLARNPTVSWAGSLLAFSRDNYDPDIWRVVDGAPPQPFIASTRFENSPQFSPDGKRLAFCSDRSGDVLDVFVSDADGSNAMQLTRGPGREQCTPRWSPDGQRIAFDSQSAEGRWKVYVIDAAGGVPRLLSASLANQQLPTWSRDGRWVYFTSQRSGGAEIWRVAVQGGDPIQITWNGGTEAAESDDGKSLYYIKHMTGYGPLFVRSITGGEERQILDSAGTRFVAVNDGLYYWATRGDSLQASVVRYLDFGTGKARDVVRWDAPRAYGLTVSPDRKTILFTGLKPINQDLMLIENFR